MDKKDYICTHCGVVIDQYQYDSYGNICETCRQGAEDAQHYMIESVYTCRHCGKFTYADVEQVLEHKNVCLKNVENKNCFTCDKFKVRLEPSTHDNKYYDTRIVEEIGYNNVGVCTLAFGDEEDVLNEEELTGLNQLCWEQYTKDSIGTIKSEMYQYFEAINEIEIEQMENLEEYNKDRLEVANQLRIMKEEGKPQDQIDKYFKVAQLNLVNKWKKKDEIENNKIKEIEEKFLKKGVTIQ